MEPMIDAVFVSSLNAGADCIQVYDGVTGTQLKSYRGAPAANDTLTPVGVAAYVMSAQRDKPFLQLWAMNKHEAQQIRMVVPGRVSALAVSPSGPKYCIVGICEKIYLYKLLSGRLIGVGSRHYQPVTKLAFTACGNYFASGGEDGFVYLWSLASFTNALHKINPPEIKPYFKLGQHSDKVTDLMITRCGMRGMVVSCSLDHTARIFDLVTGREVYTLVTAGPVTAVAANSMGSQIFLGRQDGRVTITNLLPPPPIGDVQVSEEGVACHEKEVRCIAVTGLGNQVVTGGEDGEVKVWMVTSGSRVVGAPSQPNLALHRIIHMGRGPITNLIILRLEREILNAAELEIKEMIAPFSQDVSSPLTAPVTVPIRGKPVHHHRQWPLSHGSAPKNDPGSEEDSKDLKSTVSQLQMANSQLYKLALNHIMGEISES